ncbi:HutD family protein [Alsobacter sp. SYSU M60028]|uniref:HutD family protein n=1 Tax=Alsobacter ponti TaxID=2962936 RepID=A0ABT1L6R2_9HYPH|nr:HutD family protein [Alsobacter ponti]MCP8937105.1 HutD family protein [Alsobacter ponti]
MTFGRLVRAAEGRPAPWKNGRGTTVEIAVGPVGAGFDDFDWRVSRATIAADGPFSTLQGVDRGFAPLDGSGVRLTVEGRGTVALRPGSPPFEFDGGAAAVARLIDGPVTALNVMTRRGRCAHRLFLHGEGPLAPAAGFAAALVCLGETARLRGGPELRRLDTLVAEDGRWPDWSVEAAPGGCLVALIVAAARS